MKFRNRNFIDKDIVLGNALVDMYAKYGTLEEAQKALEDHSHRNVITWSAIIFGYAWERFIFEMWYLDGACLRK